MPDTAAAPLDEAPSILRLGKDEMNLAEFPITLLTDRVPKGQKVIVYQDQIFDDKTSRTINRKLTISASEGYGLPTAVDDDVILGLIQVTKMTNNFTSRKVEFSRLDMIRRLGWPDSGFSYKRLATSLKRWLGVSLVYENAWWDKRQQAWTTKGFHILDNFEVNDSRTGGQGDLFPSNIVWNEVVFESFEAGYLKNIDYNMYMLLEHPTAKRLYRFLSKRTYHRPDWIFDLRDLAFEHIGLSRNYDGNAGKIKEKLRPALDELEAAGFLEPMGKDDRYQKDGKDWKIRLVSRPKPLALPGTPRDADQPAGLAAELIKRDVHADTAAELVRRHPAESIQLKLEVFDWLMEKQDKRAARNPPGYLIASIQKDYPTPKGFTSKAERQAREEARRAEERRKVEERRREREEQARERAMQEAIRAYWDALTPEQRDELDATIDALADAETLAIERGPLQGTFRRIRRHAYIRQLLEDRERTAVEA
jgi:hypothetical protein